MKKTGNILWGIALIAVGLIIALNALEITNINLFFSGWWTLFIIIPCLIGWVKNPSGTGNLIGMFIGLILLLSIQGFLNFAMVSRLIIPIILIAVGLSILFKDVIQKKTSEKIKQLNKERVDGDNYSATFGGLTQKVTEEFKSANVDAIFGGVELDLREATISGDQVINASAIFGGVEIMVPPNVNVKVKSTPIFGGVDDKTSTKNAENLPTIYLNCFCLFGGVEVK